MMFIYAIQLITGIVMLTLTLHNLWHQDIAGYGHMSSGIWLVHFVSAGVFFIIILRAATLLLQGVIK